MRYIGPHQSDADLHGILALQAKNHVSVVDTAYQKDQGFVTVKHNFELLKTMHQTYPAIIAREGDEVVAFALVMEQSVRHDIPVLVPMFEVMDRLSYQNRPLSAYKWFVMGQICVGESHRGQGIFDKLYQAMGEQMASEFDFILTEISERNTRSIRAHERVGFQTLHTFSDAAAGEDWQIVLWDFEKKPPPSPIHIGSKPPNL